MSDNAEFYEAFAPVYPTYYAEVDAEEAVRQWVELLERHSLLNSVAERRQHPPHLLDLGCGPGWHLKSWRSAGFLVSGLDASPSMLRQASSNAAAGPGTDIVLYCADIRDNASLESLRGKFDWIVCHFNFLSLFSPAELPTVFRSLSVLLVPGGHLVSDLTVSVEQALRYPETARTLSESCQLLSQHNFVEELRIERHWLIMQQPHHETYWIHKIPQLASLAATEKMTLAASIPWSFGDTHPSAGAKAERILLVFTCKHRVSSQDVSS